MLDAMRTAVFSSNMKCMGCETNDYEAISVQEAFRIATLGGAKGMMHAIWQLFYFFLFYFLPTFHMHVHIILS